MTRILCIDDEPAILRLLEVVLGRGGHAVTGARDARSALAAIGRAAFDAILLDLGLPDRDGLELLGTLKATCNAPVIVVSARSDVAEKVAALDLGASDYITKPFEGDELLARVRVAIRSNGHAQGRSEAIEHGPLRMDLGMHTLHVEGREVTLTPKEFSVMRELIAAGGRVLTHGALLETVWGKAHRDDVEYLRVVIRSLRLKIENDPSAPLHIRNEPGIGYRLAAHG
ncbi:response regulator transcription factor [Novosphingobium subterraneum]|uniref:response regulator transcription factor n=1 Tax=Novosphingobium subterraneum TaxID=48936 RepID=UPI003CFBEBE9